MSNQKKNAGRSREMEIQAARMFGKQMSKEKRRVLLAVTLIACALPMAMGARRWSDIPAIVPSGLIGSSGKDDSIPRWMVAFGLPGILCLLDVIAHFMLQFNQKRQTLPPAASRLIGRWGFPVISVLFCSGMILEAVGQELTLPFLTPCVLGLFLLLLGSHMWDCPRDARIALRFSWTEGSDAVWKTVHRFAGWVWMIVGLIVIAGAMWTGTSTWVTPLLVIVALAAPAVYANGRAGRLD
jgi:hypothetical protein